jgi:hypothetical protein
MDTKHRHPERRQRLVDLVLGVVRYGEHAHNLRSYHERVIRGFPSPNLVPEKVAVLHECDAPHTVRYRPFDPIAPHLWEHHEIVRMPGAYGADLRLVEDTRLESASIQDRNVILKLRQPARHLSSRIAG